MSENDKKIKQGETIENGTYEVIKSRLEKQGFELAKRVEELNKARREVFGSIETKLVGSERVITENNCVARDMVPIGDNFLFGYNVHMGLKSKVLLSDVFSLYHYENGAFTKQTLDVINQAEFLSDFEELYTYYKNTFFAKFTLKEPYLYMIFQTGKEATDIKVFKWLVKGETLQYVDNRSDHEIKFDSISEFKFIRATRDDQQSGEHPHYSIADRVFVETLNGDFTVKIENNTTTGKGIYSEPVDDPDQTLDDAEVYYAALEEMVILKVRPYHEEKYRYFIFNDKLKNVIRLDAIQNSCVLLPGGHGFVFPKGYYLKSGEYKVFDVNADYAVFDEKICSIHGEDCQYIFYNATNGVYIIYSYNMIEQSIDTPIVCCGYSHFTNGEMLVFKQEEEARQNHQIQIWQTPYVGKNYVLNDNKESLLSKIGIKDVVAAMAECSAVCKLIQKGEGYQSIYIDIVKECERILDTYYWIGNKEACNLKGILNQIKDSATFAVGEFEKVIRKKAQTQKQFAEINSLTTDLLSNLSYGSYSTIEEYVKALAQIRDLRGKIATLKELQYVDVDQVSSMDQKVREKNEDFAGRCVDFLMTEEGLKPYQDKIKLLQGEIDGVQKSKDGKELEVKMAETSSDLELLIDIVSNFKIDDPTKTTEIIEKISYLFSMINNNKAILIGKIDNLTKDEMTVQFSAQMKLLSQAVVNYLDLSDTVEKCDEYLNKVMVMIQELEGKFAEFNDYLVTIGEKREELYNAFASKKQTILDKLNQRILSLFDSAQRVINGIENRLKNLDSVEAINGYLATDIMVEKVRNVIADLQSLGDTVKADEVAAKLKTLKEDAIRQFKDKQELYVNGENVIRLGKHRFSVNTQNIDLSIVHKDHHLFYHITGTDFWDQVEEAKVAQFRDVYEQSVVSENHEVYRSEYLAYQIFVMAEKQEDISLSELSSMTEPQLLSLIQKYMEPRYQEGYTKGVHDVDATKILKTLVEVHNQIDLLVYPGDCRAFARLYWNCYAAPDKKEQIKNRLYELVKVNEFFHTEPNLESYLPLLEEELSKVNEQISLLTPERIAIAAKYLCKEIMRKSGFVVSKEAKNIQDGFLRYLRNAHREDTFMASVRNGQRDVEGTYYFIQECVKAYKNTILTGTDEESKTMQALFGKLSEYELKDILAEVIVMLFEQENASNRVIYMDLKQVLTGMVGTHAKITNGQYTFQYTLFMETLSNYNNQVVTQFTQFSELKKTLTIEFRKKIHLDEYQPKVLTSFVRNQLIDKVYLPLIGDNLAKQIGVAGEDKRTDLMGMLLLLSPPGYGKTTLMEYIASRLGIILVKINGPSLGNEVVSLDPEKAPNTGAMEELKKLNIALKMGNNVMIYLDDIQHCNTEFLQKFISLCDGQRKIDGVYDGVGQTYDLRGKKVAVVMAGNPYTESGEKFKIPDMLANRADVYNLGDMLMEDEEAFKLSYLENAVTSNPVLVRLGTSNTRDLPAMVQMANGASRETVTLAGSYSMDELNEYISVLQKLCKVRDIVLKINLEYIRSAGSADEYRNEPPFKLQGSYRNMNKIAEQVVSVMNEEELSSRILASYENDAQTLTTGAESNLLKFKKIVGFMTPEEEQRYEEIMQIYQKNKLVKDNDKVGQAVLMLSNLSDHMEKIKDILADSRL